MRWYALPILVGLIVIGLQYHRGSRDAGSPMRSAHASGALQRRRPGLPETARTLATPTRMTAALGRDLFRYADEERSESRLIEPVDSVKPPAFAAPETPVRLIGFIRTGKSVFAVLVVEGVLEVLEVEQESEGYILLEIDAEAGCARVRTPSGEEMILESEPS